MSGGRLLKSSGLAAMAAALAIFSAPVVAQAQDAGLVVASDNASAARVVLAQAEGRGPGGRGGWRDNAGQGGGNWRGGGEATSDGGGSQGRGGRSEAAPQAAAPVMQAPQAQAQPQSNWRERNGGGWQGRGSWGGNAQQAAPQAASPEARQAPQGESRWGGRSGGGEWRGRGQGGEWRGRGDGQAVGGSRWGGNAPAVPQAQVPQQGWQGGSRQTWRGDGQTQQPRQQWRGQQGGSQDWRSRGGETYRRDGNRNWSGDNAYRQDGNRNWSGDTNRWGNNNRWSGNNTRWNREWRRDNRYNWQGYRNQNRNIYNLGRYYSPYRNYSYSRLSIGFYIDSLFFGQNYLIDDPWQYRLPEVYGPYRWIRYYDDAVLVDIYSGEVVDVIHDFFW